MKEVSAGGATQKSSPAPVSIPESAPKAPAVEPGAAFQGRPNTKPLLMARDNVTLAMASDLRKQDVTASDVCLLFGLIPYEKTPADLYWEKHGIPFPISPTTR